MAATTRFLAECALKKIGKTNPKDVTPDEWKKVLSAKEYSVTREADTEEPNVGKYTMHFEDGIYTCLCCGAKLFKSDAKYHSGCGWPSFSKSIENDLNIVRKLDTSLGRSRTEVRCKQCDAHLGHVFDDGPKETNERYCINSCAIDFQKNE